MNTKILSTSGINRASALIQRRFHRKAVVLSQPSTQRSRAPLFPLLAGAVLAVSTPIHAQQTCPFDDGNSSLAVEGLILTRYALGVTGAPMLQGTGISAVDAPSVEATINCPSCGLNITGNAGMTVADATIISRKLAGYSGDALTNGLSLGSGSRNSPSAVQSFLLAGCSVAPAFPSCITGQVLRFAVNGSLQCGNLPHTITTHKHSTNIVGRFTSMAIGAEGFPVVGYYDSTVNNLRVLKCGNASCSSGNTDSGIGTTGSGGQYASIAVPADNRPIISYYDQSGADLKVVKCGNATCSSGNAVAVVDTAGITGWFTSIVVPADGLPAISYKDFTNVTLKMVKCGNAACSNSNTLTTVDASTNLLGARTAIAVGANGFPVIAYTGIDASSSSTLKIARCLNATCAAKTLVTADDTAGSGGYLSLAVGTDGRPMVSYSDEASNRLMLFRCNNSDCSGVPAAPVVLDDTLAAVMETSIAFGADGYAVVSYYDYSNRSLKLAKCGNAACTSRTTTTIDSTGEVGQATSIRVPADGLPVVSYYDYTNEALKVLKCSNASCVNP